jgi:hypothetical protein
MKTNIIILPFLFCFGCALQEQERLNPQQESSIKNEVQAVADSIWAKWEQLNPEAALQYYSEAPDWTALNSQASRFDIGAYRELAVKFKDSAVSYKWTTIRRDFKVLSKDIVLCSWIGKDEVTWSSGEKMICDPHAYTIVFQKTADQWKLIYSHDSGIPLTEKNERKPVP